jgi:hypothetical protein
MRSSTSIFFSTCHRCIPTLSFEPQFSFDLFVFIGWMISISKAFYERGQPSAADLLNKKVRIGFFIARSILAQLPTRISCLYVCCVPCDSAGHIVIVC